MKYLPFLLISFIVSLFLISCTQINALFDDGYYVESTIEYSFNRSGSLALVAINYDSTIYYSYEPHGMANHFFKLFLYDSAGNKIKTIINKQTDVCIYTTFMNDSIAFFLYNKYYNNNYDSSIIISCNLQSGDIDTVAFNEKPINGYRTFLGFSLSENGKFFFGNFEKSIIKEHYGIYQFDVNNSEIILPSLVMNDDFNGFYHSFWIGDSVLMSYYVNNDNSTDWRACLLSSQETNLEYTITNNAQNSEYSSIIEEFETINKKRIELVAGEIVFTNK